MAGRARSAAAMDAARTFVDERQEGAELGFVAFNGDVTVVQAPTSNAEALTQRVPQPARARVRHADLRRARPLDRAAARRADLGRLGRPALGRRRRRQRLRRSTTSSPPPNAPAFASSRSGSAPTPTTRPRSRRSPDGPAARTPRRAPRPSSTRSTPSSDSRLASEYLVRYRSDARPESRVVVDIDARRRRQRTRRLRRADAGAASTPYHRSLVSRFVLSPASIAVVGLAFALLLGWALLLLTRGPKRNIVERIGHFSAAVPTSLAEHRARRSSARRSPRTATRKAGGRRLERDLEIARLDWSARKVVAHDGRSVARARGRARAVLARPGAVRPRGASDRRARDRALEAPGAPRRVRGPAPGRAPGAGLGAPRRPQLQRRARQSSSRTRRTGPLRAAPGRAGRPARRAARGRDPQDGRPDGEPRPRAGRAPRRAPAHRGRQLGRGARHGRRDDPPARRAPPARPLAHRAGPHGPLDPHRRCRSR